jgi:HAD superfamily hydrolase (TIGR01459 family)
MSILYYVKYPPILPKLIYYHKYFMKPIASITDLLAHYDGFLIDLWGVIHDGSALYPGVAKSLHAIEQADKRAVLLSNAPRRVSRSAALLNWLGVPSYRYHAMLTSGEATFDYIATHHAGQRCYVLGDEEDMGLILGMPITRVYAVEEAAFVLTIGHQHAFQPLEELHDLLEAIRQRRLPMLCANPDKEVVTMDNIVYPCAGEIAEHYAAMGGDVLWFGKPYPLVYQQAVALLGLGKDARILAIGDNLDTDIRGGNAQGMDTLLITGGVLRPHVMDAIGVIDHAALARIVQTNGNTPTWYCGGFGLV